MAASVDNRQFTHLEPTMNGVVRSFKPGPNHVNRAADSSPMRARTGFPVKKPVFFQEPDEDPSSEDDEDAAELEAYRDLIKKGNSELEPSAVDTRDEGTADHWIERNPTMVRLTGKHPFNAEAPLPRLMHHGFITPVPLHYVRNHGPVPKAAWGDWSVEVTGLVKRPARFTMDQLVRDFPARELPVSLVCAGNRRKEQNMVKQTIGFNCIKQSSSNSILGLGWRRETSGSETRAHEARA